MIVNNAGVPRWYADDNWFRLSVTMFLVHSEKHTASMMWQKNICVCALCSGSVVLWSKDSGPMDMKNALCIFISPQPGIGGLLCSVSIAPVDGFTLLRVEIYPVPRLWKRVVLNLPDFCPFHCDEKLDELRSGPHQHIHHSNALLLVDSGTHTDDQFHSCSAYRDEMFCVFIAIHRWSVDALN